MKVAHDNGFACHLLADGHSTHLRTSTVRNKIPDLYMLDPDHWPAQGYFRVFLDARAHTCTDIKSVQVEKRVSLRDQLDLIGQLNGWHSMSVAGITVRSFMEAALAIIQLQFFGVSAEKVRVPASS